jgi:hypothetical protein
MKRGENGGQSASINARHLDSILAGQNASQKTIGVFRYKIQNVR